MATEKRTLQIDLKLKDSLSRSLKGAGAAIKRFGAQAKRTFKGLQSTVGKFVKNILSLKTAVLALVGAAAIGAVKSFADGIDLIAKQADALGETVENLSLLTAAFTQSGGKAENLKTIMVALVRATNEAQKPASRAARTFAQMGISVQELVRLSPANLFERMALGLEKFSTQAERGRVLQQLFPEQFVKLNKLLGEGLDNFQDSIRRAELVGARISTLQGDIAQRLSNAFGEVSLALRAIGLQMLEAFGPRTIAVLEAMAVWLAENKEEAQGLAGALGKGVVLAIQAVTAAVIELIGLIESIPGVQLIDPTSLNKQIKEAQAALTIIRKAQIDAGKFTRTQRPGADPLRGLSTFNLNVEDTPESLALKQRIDGLKAILEGGLAARLRQQVTQIGADFADAVAEIDAAVDKSGKRLPLGVTPEEMKERASEFTSVFDELGKQITKLADPPQSTNSEAPTGFFGNLTKQLETVKAQAADVAGTIGAQFGQVLTRSVDTFSNSFANVVTGITSAKEAFRQFARAFITDVARMIGKAIALGTIKSLFGLEDGGVTAGVESTQPVRQFARGGIARRPTLALFGEGKTAEAFVPLPDNRSIPVTFTGGQGSSNGVVNINITAMDSRDVRRALIEQQGVLRSIWTTQAETRHGMRQVINRAAS